MNCPRCHDPMIACVCRPSAPTEPPADHLGLLRDPDGEPTHEERATLVRLRERLLERAAAQKARNAQRKTAS